MRRGPASCAFAIALSLPLSPQAARALDDVDPQAVQATAAYARQHLSGEKLAQAAHETNQQLGLYADCKADYQPVPVSMQVVTPAEFVDGKADPVKGSWLVRYRVERCGASKVYNAVVVARDGGPPTVQPSYPGTTMANPALLRDAMRTAFLMAGAAGSSKDCKSLHVFDTQVVEGPHDVTEGGQTSKGVWNERWTFSQCGQLIDVTMVFLPSPRGGIDFHGSVAPVRPSAP